MIYGEQHLGCSTYAGCSVPYGRKNNPGLKHPLYMKSRFPRRSNSTHQSSQHYQSNMVNLSLDTLIPLLHRSRRRAPTCPSHPPSNQRSTHSDSKRPPQAPFRWRPRRRAQEAPALPHCRRNPTEAISLPGFRERLGRGLWACTCRPIGS